MAKKGQRAKFAFKCTVCGAHNYISEKNKLNSKEKLTLKKYCKHCRKMTDHKETDKLD